MPWSQILGHEERIAAFRQIVERRRLAHAYLFVGPPGIGKRRFAVELAKALLCEGGPLTPSPSPPAGPGEKGGGGPLTPSPSLPAGRGGKLEACDRCPACLLVEAGTHPDLFQVGRPEEKNEMPIDVMAGFCRNFSLKPARGRHKIGIVDDADDFNEESANCFLKTLEEPPPGSLFILIGTSLDLQLATIKSRCQLVRFAPLSDDNVRTLLTRQGVAKGLLDRLVRLAAGSPGRALALADESLWQFRRTMLQTLVQPKVNSVEAAKEFIKFAEEAGKEAAAQRRRANQALELLIAAWTDAVRLQSGSSARSADAEELPLLAALAQKAGPEKIDAMLERCLQTEAQLGRYVQISLVLEGLFDALGHLLEAQGPLPIRYLGFAD